LAYLLAQRGYEVVATDVAPDAIALAKANPAFRNDGSPEFVVADSEALSFESEFDAVVFFDSLHHAVDESAALRCAYRALRPGGMCIVLEPGRGHKEKAKDIDAEFDLTDKDMQPSHVWRVGRRVGFCRWEAFPAPQHLGKALYAQGRLKGWRATLLALQPVRHIAVQAILWWRKWYCGIAVLYKD
jgi:SAM-dependent methyltransferase